MSQFKCLLFLLIQMALLFSPSLESLSWAQTPVPSTSASVAALPLVTTQLQTSSTNTQPELTAGDLIELNVELPEQFQGAEPAMAATLLTEPVTWGEGRILWFKKNSDKSLTIGLTTYKPGLFQISSIPLQKNGVDVAATEPKEIKFGSLVKDEKDGKQEKELYPPQKAALPLKIIIAACLLGLLLVAALFFGIYKWRQRRKSDSIAQPMKRVLAPLEEFEAAVQTLDSAGFVSQAKYKALYFGISEAAKRFLGRSFHFDAEDRTTRELGQELLRRVSNEPIVNEWNDLFEEMDIVKFTDQAPSDSQARALSSRVLQLAQRTFAVSPEAQAKVTT